MTDVALWLDCSIEEVLPGGDHEIVLFRVGTFESFDGVSPLVFHGSKFRELVI
ncbi:flavin reductase family protein [Prauserella endophytica]|uniref:Flavin reductase family protein n=1 Tax=Prauserella endophytica TaxID=1592324 RepID=A0ABY2RS65_9PSEU|nr:flavin reductase family protein [Prauserella endophytica]